MSTSQVKNRFGARSAFDTGSGKGYIYSLNKLQAAGGSISDLSRLPYSIKVLLEAVLRACDGNEVTEEDVLNLANWHAKQPAQVEIPFKPARVILQDFTGVPSLVDLAAMRSAMKRLGGDPEQIQPLIPVDLVIDHSVQVDRFGSPDALRINAQIEFERNRERYEFLRWGQKAFRNFRVIPPATGIVHQVNLEFLAKTVLVRQENGDSLVIPDTLVGTDSHTTMINGLGVLGWGVGGIEAEAVMLGQPLFFLTPQVVGFKLYGKLRDGVTATDLTLTITQTLRKKGVVDKFVEFYGSGLSQMTLPDRATIANMAPEYGATCGFFPVDQETTNFLLRTGRTREEVGRVERYCKEQGLFRTDDSPDPEFTDTLELDLSDVVSSLAGPKRPQDRVQLSDLKSSFRRALTAPVSERGYGLSESDLERTGEVRQNGENATLRHGSIVISAITSCTNTSNPSVMLCAGLLAQKAVQKGLSVPPYVKTSMAPGSKVVTEYLQASGTLSALEQIGFNVVGYGCTTCIGNSGPLPESVAKAVTEGNLVAAAVLSGNRNFEGRINPLTKAHYLASPPLVVAYALAGSVDIDLSTEPLGTGKDGQPVFLHDLWPSQEEISSTMGASIEPDMFIRSYGNVFDGNPTWNAIPVAGSELYEWNPESTYIQNPPFFESLTTEPQPLMDISGARVLAVLGDSVTTDHISPAGSISADGPAGLYLIEKGIEPRDFNSYGSRRGNDRVMTRGTFANIRLKNLLVQKEGGVTIHFPSGEEMSIYDAAMRYRSEGTPLVVIAGKEYGSGSSRDWAAKGPMLMGVRAVLAESYERIHRSNLVGLGVLPLQFKEGQTPKSLGLTGHETFDIAARAIEPRQDISIHVTDSDGRSFSFDATVRIDSPVELDYYMNGGILQTVMRRLLKAE